MKGDRRDRVPLEHDARCQADGLVEPTDSDFQVALGDRSSHANVPPTGRINDFFRCH
jgi:hypothetical protein